MILQTPVSTAKEAHLFDYTIICFLSTVFCMGLFRPVRIVISDKVTVLLLLISLAFLACLSGRQMQRMHFRH
jgi:hypothetical protein